MTAAELEWSEGEPPRSSAYGDIYFSREDGLAEARAVFLGGCGLPEAWADHRIFTVAELGFGTGLNIVALLDLWRRTRPLHARLAIFTVEAHLMRANEARRALESWPDISETASVLLEQWPRPTRGFHRIDFHDVGATLDVAAMEAGEALDAWSGRADAWFLDGFSPALNPAMWRPDLIDRIAARSAPGARLATYTVAGAVRRDLERVGFAIERKPGFGRKRERLEARFPGRSVPRLDWPRVAVIGGGIAGASLRRAFAALGIEARVLADAKSPTASAAPAALVLPRLDAGLAAPAALFAQAFHRATDLYRNTPAAVIASGALQLAAAPDDRRRFAKIAASDLFDPATTRVVDDPSSIVGEPAPEGLMFDDALVVDPTAIAAAWLGQTDTVRVGSITRVGDVWTLISDLGAVLAEAEIVVIAAGVAGNALLPSLDLGAVRGQASVAVIDPPATATLFGGYAIPTREGVMFGATHDRGETTLEIREDDQARNGANLAAALPVLAGAVAGHPLEAYVGVRATTKDFLPLAGVAEAGSPGLFVLSGLGSRGFCLAPLLAEHVAALALNVPSPLPSASAAIVDPGRFAKRADRVRPRKDRDTTGNISPDARLVGSEDSKALWGVQSGVDGEPGEDAR